MGREFICECCRHRQRRVHERPLGDRLPAHPQGVVAADFNRDGRIDLAVASENSTG